jgi:hypothetical protein
MHLRVGSTARLSRILILCNRLSNIAVANRNQGEAKNVRPMRLNDPVKVIQFRRDLRWQTQRLGAGCRLHTVG